VTSRGTRFSYRGERDGAECFAPCERGSLDEFLLERYVAFTQWRALRRMFRVRHDPWPQARVEVTVDDEGLLRERFPWWPETRQIGANFSPGATTVTISRPQFAKTREHDDENVAHGQSRPLI